jgi:hypothetical protein
MRREPRLELRRKIVNMGRKGKKKGENNKGKG